MKQPIEKHSLLVAPLNQHDSASHVISRAVLKCVEFVYRKLSERKARVARNQFYKQIADLPPHILEDIGIEPDDIARLEQHKFESGQASNHLLRGRR